MIVARRAVVLALALVLAGCGSSPTPQPLAASLGPEGASPSPTLTPFPSAPAAPPAAPAAVPGASLAMSLPWPSTGAGGTPLSHPWTGGPHAYYNGSDCLPAEACAKDVPVSIRSGIDFGSGGGPDWDVYAVASGTLVYKGPLPGGFGAGAVTQHGDLFVVYAHMALASLDTAPAVGSTVGMSTKLGTTWCTGMVPCTASSSNHHLHLELRSGLSVSGATVTLGANVAWDARIIGGWTIKAGALNYNGTATACGTTITADVTGPKIYDASTCGAPVTPPTVVSGTWVAPKDGATLTTSTLTLSARPAMTPSTLTVTKVAFSIKWGSTTKAACSTTKAGSGDVWSCKVDLLKLGAPLGKLTLTFDVTDSLGDVAKAPAGGRPVIFGMLPGAPGNVHFDPHCIQNMNCGNVISATVTWTQAPGIVTGYRIYWGVVNDFCAKTWTYSNKLVGTVGVGARSWSGKITNSIGHFLVVAYNQAGAGKGTASEILGQDFVCGG
jgi:murein DD-endopeptidase MepM/ murein hydrolase activator NlpD